MYDRATRGYGPEPDVQRETLLSRIEFGWKRDRDAAERLVSVLYALESLLTGAATNIEQRKDDLKINQGGLLNNAVFHGEHMTAHLETSLAIVARIMDELRG